MWRLKAEALYDSPWRGGAVTDFHRVRNLLLVITRGSMKQPWKVLHISALVLPHSALLITILCGTSEHPESQGSLV
jgi:hypothetical protein